MVNAYWVKDAGGKLVENPNSPYIREVVSQVTERKQADLASGYRETNKYH